MRVHAWVHTCTERIVALWIIIGGGTGREF